MNNVFNMSGQTVHGTQTCVAGSVGGNDDKSTRLLCELFNFCDNNVYDVLPPKKLKGFAQLMRTVENHIDTV